LIDEPRKLRANAPDGPEKTRRSISIHLRNVVGVDHMMWGSDYPHSESTFPRSRQILEGVPDDEQAKIAGGDITRVYDFNVARLTASA